MVTPSYPIDGKSIRGGVAGVTYYLASELAQSHQVDISVVVMNTEQSPSEVVHRPECDIYFAPKPENHWRRSKEQNSIISRLARDLGCDLVHSQGNASAINKSVLPSLLTIHGLNERDTLYRHGFFSGKMRSIWFSMTEARCRTCIPNVIAISPYVRQFLSKNQRIWDIWNPVDNHFFDISRSPEKGRVLFAGIVSPLKNVKSLIEAFIVFRKKHHFGELFIAGDMKRYPYYVRECQKVILEEKAQEYFYFLGGLSLEKMYSEMSKCQILALCSQHEVAPLVISESMAAGIPILASRVSGIPYMVEEGITGRLVNQNSLESIYRGMETLLLKDDLNTMSNNAKRLAEDRFRACAAANRTIDIYKQILA